MASRGRGRIALTCDQVADIKRLYRASRRGRKMRTMGQIAEIMGVSTSTVFKAIYDVPPYQPETRALRKKLERIQP